ALARGADGVRSTAHEPLPQQSTHTPDPPALYEHAAHHVHHHPSGVTGVARTLDARPGDAVLFATVGAAAVYVVRVLHDAPAARAARERRPREDDEHPHVRRQSVHQLRGIPHRTGVSSTPSYVCDDPSLPPPGTPPPVNGVPRVPTGRGRGGRVFRA